MFVRSLLAALTCLVAVLTPALTAAPPAHATGSYSLAQVRLPDGRTTVLRWNGCQDITYKINLDPLPTSLHAQAKAEIRGALVELNERTGLRFLYEGTTHEVPQIGSGPGQSAELVIAYTRSWLTNYDLSGSQFAKGGYFYNTWWSRGYDGSVRWDAAITRGFVVIDADDALTRLRPGFGPGMTRGNLLLHELGHVVGLQHVEDYSQMMAPLLSPYTPGNYQSGDDAALYRVSRAYGCIDVPSWASADLG